MPDECLQPPESLRASVDRASQSILVNEAWRQSKGGAHVLRYVSLLYTGFFFIEPYYRHSVAHWFWFAGFYISFLTVYFLIVALDGLPQKLLIAVMFCLAFVYFPFNSSASGAFVYAIVMLAFIMRNTRAYLVALAAQILGIALETWVFHLPWWSGAMGAFFCVVIGLSNLSYSRQQRANYMLQKAYDQIEHLAQVGERERIARDLHDLLGHTLTVITIKSELANRLFTIDPERSRQEMVEVEETARKALADVREAVVGYRSQGFTAEISRARRMLTAADVSLSTAISPVELTPAETNVLCLCVREAVTNIVRHALAKTCTVQLVRTTTGLRMTIEDDGAGIHAREGNGLRGMRERIEGLEGHMRISSGQGNGTRLLVDLPRSSETAAAAHQVSDEVHA